MKKRRRTPGPAPERLKIEAPEGWIEAVKKALRKKKPAKGWPKDSK